MSGTRSVLSERIEEIRRTKSLIYKLQNNDPNFVSQVFGSNSSQLQSLRPLFSTFALMHYSLIEAVITVGITEMVDHISRDNLKNANEDYLKFIIQCRLKDLKDLNFSKWYDLIKDLIDDYSEDNRTVTLSEDQVRSLWAGNLDARKIRDALLSKLKLELRGVELARNGVDLRRIKDDRNDLAHGVKSWDEVGADYTWQELASMSNRILIYAIQFVKCIENGLSDNFWITPNQEEEIA
ncbi:MAG: MAE_28990/MAE_18760 family HEPN-like nuclease [Verrucomicrobiota bacterium]